MKTEARQQKTTAVCESTTGQRVGSSQTDRAAKAKADLCTFPDSSFMNFSKRGILAALFLSTLALGGTRALACPPTLTPATGGSAIASTTVGGTWTTLTGPVLAEGIAGEIGTGTIVLKAPAGFIFNSGAAVTVKVTGCSTASKNLNNLANGSKITATVTSTTITITMNARSTGSISNALTWQNIQVRPTATTPLASGNMSVDGTADIFELPCDANAGSLCEVAGAVAGYKISGSSTGTAGTPITITVQKVDHSGNPVSDGTDKTMILSGLGNNGGPSPVVDNPAGTFGNGLNVAFNNNGSATITFTAYAAETGTLNVTDGSISSTPPSGSGLNITIKPGPATKLVFTSVPNAIAYGSTFSAAVRSVDAYGNPSTSGLGSLLNVTLAQTTGPGNLVGTLLANLGTSGGNGSVAFSGISFSSAGNNHILQASALGLSAATSTVNVAPLIVTPVISVSGKIYDGTTLATISSRSLSCVVGSDAVSLGTSGSANFADKNVGTGKGVNVTGLALTGAAAGNYQLSTTSFATTANISPRPITISAVMDSKTYDGTTTSAALPVLTVGSLVGGDTLNRSQTFADKKVGAGKTLIPSGSVNDGNGGNNYNLTMASVTTGSITPRTLTVRANDQTQQYGSPAPTFTASYSGFAPGESLATCGLTGSPNLSSTATSTSLPGTYPISITLGSLTAANYIFNLIDGTLTVVPATNTDPGDINDGLSVWIVNQEGTNHLAMKFKRNKNAAALGLQYLPQVSSDKQSWLFDVANILETSVLSLDAQFDWVTVQDQTPITPDAPRFIQLKVLAN